MSCYVIDCNILVVVNSKINIMDNVNRKWRKNTDDEGSDVLVSTMEKIVTFISKY